MPELVFALIAPIGVDLDLVCRILDQSLAEKRYVSEVIRLTDIMTDIPVSVTLTDSSFVAAYQQKIAYANEVRRVLGDTGLAALAVSAIRTSRRAEWKQREISGAEDIPTADARDSVPVPNRAYVIRQLKRPEEVTLLRQIYGKHLVAVSVFAPVSARIKKIRDKERSSRGGLISNEECEHLARSIVSQDSNEIPDAHGQNVRDAFPLADVIIDGTSEGVCQKTLRRFLDLFFGSNVISPTIDEYGMYLAKSASLRSCDLSRQVGAAIFKPTREIISLGCNEVPKAGGGTYWSEDDADQRDIVLGHDPNELRKVELFTDVIQRLQSMNKLSTDLMAIDDPHSITKLLLDTGKSTVLHDAKIMDLLEFGRVIHAEMSAISDAARLGRAVGGATLYCTTFPCHICAKHIVASGIRRVVYLEPYPKSYAADLHSDSIDVEGGNQAKVRFESFIGVSPYRYRDLFEKGRRKYAGGLAQSWNKGEQSPMIDALHPSYFQAETKVASELDVALAKITAA